MITRRWACCRANVRGGLLSPSALAIRRHWQWRVFTSPIAHSLHHYHSWNFPSVVDWRAHEYCVEGSWSGQSRRLRTLPGADSLSCLRIRDGLDGSLDWGCVTCPW